MHAAAAGGQICHRLRSNLPQADSRRRCLPDPPPGPLVKSDRVRCLIRVKPGRAARARPAPRVFENREVRCPAGPDPPTRLGRFRVTKSVSPCPSHHIRVTTSQSPCPSNHARAARAAAALPPHGCVFVWTAEPGYSMPSLARQNYYLFIVRVILKISLLSGGLACCDAEAAEGAPIAPRSRRDRAEIAPRSRRFGGAGGLAGRLFSEDLSPGTGERLPRRHITLRRLRLLGINTGLIPGYQYRVDTRVSILG